MKGLTLIETIIYLALVFLIITTATSAIYPIINNADRSQAWVEVENEANFIIRKISWAMNNVSTINSPAANGTLTVLSLTKNNFSPNPIVFDIDDGDFRMTLGTSSPVVISSGNVRISNALFKHTASSGLPSMAEVNFDISYANASTTVKTTVGLRK
ncbi:MAG: hypothetical protein UT92_C0001G0045 [Candidatus Curtissbacteria bacterium GW2011_GWA1_40_24]|uniref:Uncharacterized protein n=2 Tax=Patescibacteria group TaxID=1783273 RepID=A0A0G0UZD1_9BACT|nr:MAG: hypothetical protein UT92_C0001G0045 [Candidatus Curtissbacteria bacterium GW2011_GWA1_40_24]KKR89042.1 MAG: hypothetical protein UU38_C0002G0045 [Candidatus Wolfebacteria bacterium GW2011_GWB1_41_12]